MKSTKAVLREVRGAQSASCAGGIFIQEGEGAERGSASEASVRVTNRDAVITSNRCEKQGRLVFLVNHDIIRPRIDRPRDDQTSRNFTRSCCVPRSFAETIALYSGTSNQVEVS